MESIYAAARESGLTVMIILGLFLAYLAASSAAFAFIEWLVRWLGGATMSEAVLVFALAFGAAAALIILVVNQWRGIIVAVAVIVFWSFVMFGAAGTTAIRTLAFAGATLVVAAAVAVMESLRRRWAGQDP